VSANLSSNSESCAKQLKSLQESEREFVREFPRALQRNGVRADDAEAVALMLKRDQTMSDILRSVSSSELTLSSRQRVVRDVETQLRRIDATLAQVELIATNLENLLQQQIINDSLNELRYVNMDVVVRRMHDLYAQSVLDAEELQRMALMTQPPAQPDPPAKSPHELRRLEERLLQLVQRPADRQADRERVPAQ